MTTKILDLHLSNNNGTSPTLSDSPSPSSKSQDPRPSYPKSIHPSLIPSQVLRKPSTTSFLSPTSTAFIPDHKSGRPFIIPSRDSALSDTTPSISILENSKFLASLSQMHTLFGNPGIDPQTPAFSTKTTIKGRRSPDLPCKIREKEKQRVTSSVTSAEIETNTADIPALAKRYNDEDSIESDNDNSCADLPVLVDQTTESLSDASTNYPPSRLRGGNAPSASSSNNNSSKSYSSNSSKENLIGTVPTVISFSSEWDSDSNLPAYHDSIEHQVPSSPSLSYEDVDSDCSSIDLDDTDAIPIGGRIEKMKPENAIRISGCNPNGINIKNSKSQLQHSIDMEIDIQCYSEVNLNFLKSSARCDFQEAVSSMDKNTKVTWSTSDVPCDSDFKPGGTCIINRGSTKSRIKSFGSDSLGRGSWQLLTGEGSREILIISVYQCCSSSSDDARNTTHRQQQTLLSEQNRPSLDPRKNVKKDITTFFRSMRRRNPSLIPIIIGDWNEECTDGSTPYDLCQEFGLVNIFERLYPNHPQFKTYQRGSRVIDFALAPPQIADKISNFVYEPFLYRLTELSTLILTRRFCLETSSHHHSILPVEDSLVVM